MTTLDHIEARLAGEWLPTIYRDRIRSQRTRSYSFEVSKGQNNVSILHTLLGVELKVGRKRFSCPDLATARYLQVFARIGCRDFAVPYDITKISPLADELELGWQKALILCAEAARRDGTDASRLRGAMTRRMRKEIEDIGPGDAMPEFKQETRQKKSK